MKIQCHTNLDLYPYEQWPTELPCRPMKGDLITSSSGLELAVVGITFKEIKEKSYQSHGGYYEEFPRLKKETLCKVELHLPPHRFENISRFQEWYRKRRP